MYMTQTEDDLLDIVVITGTTYNNNIIRVNTQITGAAPGVQTLLCDDPPVITKDIWNWNSGTNSGNFSWDLTSYFTDGVVLGHIQIVDNFCFRAQFLPNYNGAVAKIVFLSGNATNPTRVLNTAYTSSYFEFCQYPQAIISKNDASCGSLGSATASSLNGTATYLWTRADGSTVGTTATVTGLSAGTYTVTVTVNGCTASRPVTIGSTGVPIVATYVVVNPTKTQSGSITLAITGGTPPYTITWKNSQGTVVATSGTVLPVSAANADTYTVIITDGCSTQSYDITIGGVTSCPAGTMNDPNSDGCLSCPPGTYSGIPNSDTCTVCPPGSWNTVVNATSCNTCAANTVSGGYTGPCTSCGVSTYSAAGSGVCTACPAGTDRPSGSSSCTPCSAGSYRCADSGVCQSCTAGTYSVAGQASCTPCDPGTYSSSGSTSCSNCSANSYAPSGASSCTTCPSGLSAPASSTVLLACM